MTNITYVSQLNNNDDDDDADDDDDDNDDNIRYIWFCLDQPTPCNLQCYLIVFILMVTCHSVLHMAVMPKKTKNLNQLAVNSIFKSTTQRYCLL